MAGGQRRRQGCRRLLAMHGTGEARPSLRSSRPAKRGYSGGRAVKGLESRDRQLPRVTPIYDTGSRMQSKSSDGMQRSRVLTAEPTQSSFWRPE